MFAGLEALLGQVVGVAAGHALDAQPVLDEEGRVEADEQHPEVDLAEPLVEHPAGQLRPPEVVAGEHREDHGAEDRVVEVRDDEVAVGQVEVESRAGEDDAGQAAEEEGRRGSPSPTASGVSMTTLPPHIVPIQLKNFTPGRHRDEHRHHREEGQQHLAGHVHVVRPDARRECRDGDRREDQRLVAEDRLAREDRDDLADDAEERQRDDVDLGMAEEPEQVLPQHRPAVLRVEDVHPEAPVTTEREERGGEDREDDEHEDRGDEHGPREDRHPEHRHAGGAHADDRRDEVDRAEDRAEAGEGEAEDPQVATERPGCS